MPELDVHLSKGQELLQYVALRYASQHGLHPDKIDWICPSGDEWWLQVTTAEHSVKVAFSPDEIIDFAEGGEGSSSSKVKIRNAFASLAM
jgi:hypothetical protein